MVAVELVIFIVMHLVMLHSIDGHDVAINPAQVTSLHAARPGEPNKLLTDQVACVVGLTNGKFVSVIEHCDVVRRLLEENGR